MTDAMRDLGRRAVACRGWRWMEGMRAVRVEDGRKYRVNTASLTSTAYVPDLTDAATLGCILALYEETRTTLSCPDPIYTYASAYGLFHPKTLEALVHALEAP